MSSVATPASKRAGNRAPVSATLVAGSVLVGLIVLAAVTSLVWTPFEPTAMHPADRLNDPSGQYWFGTDKFGRDTFSQIMVGARTTLFVGVVAVGVAALIGVPLGMLAAMAPRPVGRFIMRVTDIVLAFPALLLAIMLGAVFGGSTLTAMVAIGIASIPSFTRVVRSTALQVMASDYVLAARVAGRSLWSTARIHVWPGVRGIVIVQSSVAFALAVLAEAALSFLGLGTPPPVPSWGRMLQESQELLFTQPRLAIVPGIAIAVSVLGFNLLGDGLRDVFDPRLRGSR
ncbi:MAG: ABC transporter permease [Dermatophilus congolensis]|nr:ABC transporter permease [Dermatophilus congolensis]